MAGNVTAAATPFPFPVGHGAPANIWRKGPTTQPKFTIDVEVALAFALALEL